MREVTRVVRRYFLSVCPLGIESDVGQGKILGFGFGLGDESPLAFGDNLYFFVWASMVISCLFFFLFSFYVICGSPSRACYCS